MAQEITIAEGAKITIKTNASVYFAGLIIKPDKNYSLHGAQSLAMKNLPAKDNAISRSYEFSQLISDFSGTIVFSYQGVSLDDLLPSDLVLALKDAQGDWQYYRPSVDSDEQTLTYRFETQVDLSTITASQLELVTNLPNLNESSEVLVFPNPAKDILHMHSVIAIERIDLFAVDGTLMHTKNSSDWIDLSSYPAGIYLIKVQLANDTQQTIKIIKKD